VSGSPQTHASLKQFPMSHTLQETSFTKCNTGKGFNMTGTHPLQESVFIQDEVLRDQLKHRHKNIPSNNKTQTRLWKIAERNCSETGN
jgi:hypothetical protein